MPVEEKVRKFDTGRVVITNEVNELVEKDERYKRRVMNSFMRFISGDWGDLPEEDKETNELALMYEERVIGRYNILPKPIYIMTEWDRSVTTILFPEEY